LSRCFSFVRNRPLVLLYCPHLTEDRAPQGCDSSAVSCRNRPGRQVDRPGSHPVLTQSDKPNRYSKPSFLVHACLALPGLGFSTGPVTADSLFDPSQRLRATFYSCRLQAELHDAAYALTGDWWESVGAAPIYEVGFLQSPGWVRAAPPFGSRRKH